MKRFNAFLFAIAAIMIAIGLMPRTARTQAAAWHPANWDTTLPSGVAILNTEGYRIVPDTTITPGLTDPTVTLADLSKPAYIKAARNVPQSEKDRVYALYKVPPATRAQLAVKYKMVSAFEVDHDISIENGGANGVANLWPEPYFGAWNAHDKDRLENYLHKLCKAGTITLDEDQDEVRGYHWVWSYLHYFGTPKSAQ